MCVCVCVRAHSYVCAIQLSLILLSCILLLLLADNGDFESIQKDVDYILEQKLLQDEVRII